MNFLLASDKANAGKRVSFHSCFFCKKVFNNHRALGGHLRAHQEEIRARKSWNYPGRSSNSIDITSTNANPLSNTQIESSSGDAGNNLSPVPNRASSPPDFPKQFYSNETAQLNASKFFRNNLGNIETQFITSPTLSSGSGSSEVRPSNCLSSTSYAPSSSHAATGLPPDSSIRLGSNGVFQNNTDQFGTCMDGAPFYSMHDWQNLQHQNPSTLLSHDFASGNPHPGSGSNEIPRFNESTTTGSLPRDLCQRSGKDEVTQYNKSTVLTCEGGKRPHFVDVPGSADMMNASKWPRINLDPPVERETPKQKELPLIKDMENSFPESVISSGAKEEDIADLDLSLHL